MVVIPIPDPTVNAAPTLTPPPANKFFATPTPPANVAAPFVEADD